MSDQLQPQGDISYQGMVNTNNVQSNMNQVFPQQMLGNSNLHNNMLSATGGNNYQSQQMFDMFNNMMKMMMSQNGNQLMNQNMVSGMFNQQTNSGSNGIHNSQQIGNGQVRMNSYGNGSNLPSNYQSQQQLKQNNNNFNNTMANNYRGTDNQFRNQEDKFNISQNDIQNLSPIGMKYNNINLASKNIQYPSEITNNSYNFNLPSTSEQLPFKTEEVDFENNIENSSNFNYNTQKQNHPNLKGQSNKNINYRGVPPKDEEIDQYNQGLDIIHQKNNNNFNPIYQNDDIKYINKNQTNYERIGSNINNDIFTNNLNNDIFINNNKIGQNPIQNQQNNSNQFSDQKVNQLNLNDINEFSIENINKISGNQNQTYNILNQQQQKMVDQKNIILGSNQQQSFSYKYNNNNFNQGYENNDQYGQFQSNPQNNMKHLNTNEKFFLSDNEQQQSLMNNLKTQNNKCDDQFNKQQNVNNQQQRNQHSHFQNNRDDEYFLPKNQMIKNNNLGYDDERVNNSANNILRNTYESEKSQRNQNQKDQNVNKNSQLMTKVNQIDDNKSIQSQQNKYFDDERPIQSELKNNILSDQGNQSERRYKIQSQRNFNPLDEMPIKSTGNIKCFEDLIEEQLKQDGEDEYEENNNNQYQKKKSFLKKGTRSFLSNATTRSKAAQSHIEEIGNEQIEKSHNSINIPTKPKKNESTTYKSTQSLTTSGCLINKLNSHENKPIGSSKPQLSQIHSMGGLDSQNRSYDNQNECLKQVNKQKKKFLQRGQGKGGGIQGFIKEDEPDSQIIKETPENKNNLCKKDSKPLLQKKQQKDELISFDDEENYSHIIKKKKDLTKKCENEFGTEDENFDQDDMEFGGKKYQLNKYLQDNQDDIDDTYDQKKKNSKFTLSSKLLAQKEGDSENKQFTKIDGCYKFDDEEEWGDDSNTKKSNKNDFGQNKSIQIKQEGENKNKLNIRDSDAESDKLDENEDKDNQSQNNDDDNGDPDEQYSKVVQKYFNKKGSNIDKTGKMTSSGIQPKGASSSTISLNNLTQEQKRQLIQEFTNEQIDKLNTEISKFKLEYERVKKMRSKYEELLKSFNKEKEQFAKQKELEILELEEFKKEEQKKILNEKRIASRQSKAMQNMPNRKEREEIEGFKDQIKKLQEEIKIKDQRNKLTLDRQKKLLDEQTQKNQELLDEIKHLEKLRIESGSTKNTSAKHLPSQKNTTKSPFKNQQTQNTLEDKNDDNLVHDNIYQRNKMGNVSQISNNSQKRVQTFGEHYEKQVKNIQFYDKQYGQNHYQDDNNYEEDEDQFQNYENYNRNQVSLKGKKQGTLKNNIKNKNDERQDDQNYSDYENQDSEEDKNLETYEDIINFNPANNIFSERKDKKEVKQNKNLQNQNQTDIPSIKDSVQNRLSSKNSSISISNNNTNKSNPISTLSSPSKNERKKTYTTAINETSNKENKQSQQIIGSIQQQHQIQQQQLKQNKITKKYLYDINTLSKVKNLSIKAIDQDIQRNQFQYDQNIYYLNYLQSIKKPNRVINENISQDGKTQTIYEDGKQQFILTNKVKRQLFPNGYTLVNFVNSDVKQVLPDSTIIYYFYDAQITQTTLPNGINIFKFQDDQIEIHYPNHRKEIKYSDGTEKFINEDGVEKTILRDGTIEIVDVNKINTKCYSNGKEEVQYSGEYE